MPTPSIPAIDCRLWHRFAHGLDGSNPFNIVLPNGSTIFVDQSLVANITNGTYNQIARDDSGSDGNAYKTGQEAINACTVGDIIYARGGTYAEVNIDIPESKNGTAWTTGNFTTLMSYPGEWAKFDATGLNLAPAFDWHQQNVFRHPTSYSVGVDIDYNEYWRFSNFEITGGRCGVFLKMRHFQFRYMYIHDNGRDLDAGAGYDSLIAGIFSSGPQYVDIKYCWIVDNIQTNAVNNNNANILFDSDYKDDFGDSNGNAWNPLASTHHNEIAYNRITGSRIGIRQKNQQRFGLNDRSPLDFTYEDYGDDWHHNIVLGQTAFSIACDQDFCQVHNNVTDAGIALGMPAQIPLVYHAIAYNNGTKHGGVQTSYGGISTNGGYEAITDNFYDNAGQKTVHEHVHMLNNINDGKAYPYSVIALRPTAPHNPAGNPDYDDSDLNIDRNLSHDSSAYRFGGIAVDGPDGGVAFTVAEFNVYIDAARGLGAGTTKNWDSVAAGLWADTVGVDQYKAVGTFVVESGMTVADSGVTMHPYLAVTLPSYLGAIDPSDGAWAGGVYDSVPTVAWLTAQTTDPTWVE